MKMLIQGKNRGGSVSAAGTAQTVAERNTARSRMTFQNTSDTPMKLTEDDTDASATNGYLIAPGASAEISTNQRISLWCATAGKTFASTEI